MASQDLESVAQTLVAEGKEILAADETIPTFTAGHFRIRLWRLGMAGTRIWWPARMPSIAEPIAMVRRVLGNIPMRWSWSW